MPEQSEGPEIFCPFCSHVGGQDAELIDADFDFHTGHRGEHHWYGMIWRCRTHGYFILGDPISGPFAADREPIPTPESDIPGDRPCNICVANQHIECLEFSPLPPLLGEDYALMTCCCGGYYETRPVVRPETPWFNLPVLSDATSNLVSTIFSRFTTTNDTQ